MPTELITCGLCGRRWSEVTVDEPIHPSLLELGLSERDKELLAELRICAYCAEKLSPVLYSFSLKA